ncbi:phosphodiester glycosidase family protein [Streptomyces sp. MST-110588]|uniref:phosphodiester glycosidase family protein n=1 Tax=Streptomyces sp. MST-110588 TaxID=2833628 RepID=UPI001F5D0222|nr:phosphodiester glycosidase family protein [Streptomyces sp. MST-110588]UNO43250.1 phosphodiester glycosidase family protein [Streptomyces sp. MST-110588]
MRATATVLAAWSVLAGGAVAAGPPATATAHTTATATGKAPALGRAAPLAPGVEYRDVRVPVSRGVARAHLLTVDLAEPGVSADLLYPGAVGARAPVSRLADGRGAVGAVNGDFFNITEVQHPGVEATGAPVGPAIASGRTLKAAVPDGQRFGPALPPTTTTEDVLGVGYDRRARLDRLSLRGTARTPDGTLPLRGLNQYALPVNGIGAYTPLWGPTSRVRATCGTDTDRAAPCSQETYEVTVRRGKVVGVARVPGRGGVAKGTVVLVGREEGARQLRKLSPGDPVGVGYRLVSRRAVPLRFAVGGFPIVRNQEPLAGLDTVTAAVRTSAGIGEGGHVLYLLALDGAAGNAGMTVRELAELMDRLGAEDALNLDGGGSSTLVTREPGSPGSTVRNHPSDGAERPVPNAVGIFSRR